MRRVENPGTLLIRADASAAIGTGHVMRCLALAQAWQDAGGKCVFAMAEVTPAIGKLLGEEQCRVMRIAGTAGGSEDAGATRAVAANEAASWIVIDGYEFDAKYRVAVQEAGRRYLIIDDNGGDGCFGCDLLLNQNLHAAEAMYPQRGSHTRLLLGPRYALLRDDVAEQRCGTREISEKAARVLITMGGSDPSNSTPRILAALAELPELEIRVAIGGSGDHTRAAEGAAAALRDRVRLFRDARNMGELMRWADVAIAGAGTTCWEMCLLGLPAMLIVVASNQENIAQGLASAGAALCLGRAATIDIRTLANETKELLASPERRRAMSRAACELVDGRGRERVLDAMGVGESVCA